MENIDQKLAGKQLTQNIEDLFGNFIIYGPGTTEEKVKKAYEVMETSELRIKERFDSLWSKWIKEEQKCLIK